MKASVLFTLKKQCKKALQMKNKRKVITEHKKIENRSSKLCKVTGREKGAQITEIMDLES